MVAAVTKLKNKKIQESVIMKHTLCARQFNLMPRMSKDDFKKKRAKMIWRREELLALLVLW